MSRPRTTWNKDEIKTAAMSKQADPYLMNQDHVSKNPPAAKYMNGDPSSWAEDVHEPNEWDAEYSGGTTKRNEIGEPEFRSETFNHAEKTASVALLVKKADLAVKTARLFLPRSVEASVEDQAVALMSLPDHDLIETFQRLAQDQDAQEGQKDQKQQASQQDDQGQKDQKQQASQQDQGGQEKDQQKQQASQEQGQQDQGQQKQQAGMQQQSAMDQCMEAMQQGDQQKAQAAVQKMVQEAMQQHQQKMAASKKAQEQGQEKDQQKQPAGMQQQSAEQMKQQIQSMVQQAVEQQMQGSSMQDNMPMTADDQMLDDMLAPQANEEPMMEDIEMETSPMDMGEVEMGPEDEVLKSIFANQESDDAEQAEQHQQASQQQDQQGQQKQAAVRTASTRTVGTKPTNGVGRVGGTGSKTASSGKADQLSSLWATAPDVRDVFGLK